METERRKEYLKKGDICEGVIEKVIFPNKGIVYIGDGVQ